MAEYLLILNRMRKHSLRKQRQFRERDNPLELEDNVLLQKYRFPRHVIFSLIEKLKPFIERKTLRNKAIPPHLQVLVALRFFASGSFQNVTGDVINISQASVSRIVYSITDLLCKLSKDYIKFPTDSNELIQLQQKFQGIHGFPRVLGLIDGTLIDIKSPGGLDEPLYVSRKGKHAINVQIVSDNEMRIIDIVVKWPGSTHDSFIWTNSQLRNKFESNPPNGWLLGDSGYPLEPWLLTPILKPQTNSEMKYNRSHKKTRRIVENTIGLMKMVFRCLDNSGGNLCYNPLKVCKIILSVAVLHNMRRNLSLIEDNLIIDSIESENDEFIDNQSNVSALHTLGLNIRNNLIQQRFA